MKSCIWGKYFEVNLEFFTNLRKLYIPVAVFASDDVIVFGGFLHNNFVNASLSSGGDGSNAVISQKLYVINIIFLYLSKSQLYFPI